MKLGSSSTSTWRERLDFGIEGNHVQPALCNQPLTSICACNYVHEGLRDQQGRTEELDELVTVVMILYKRLIRF